MAARAPSNACRTLARREVTGQGSFGSILPRQTLSLHQVFREEAGGVLLGFSNDGHFLIYCISLDSCYQVQWRKINFQDFYHWREDGQVPEIVFKLRVEGGTSDYGVSTPLEVWQSADEALVLAITMDNWSQERESSRLARVVVAPSPLLSDGAATVTTLSFEFTQLAFLQKPENWQLLQFVSGSTKVYHLVVNDGTALHVLVFHVWRKRDQRRESVSLTTNREEDARPRGLGISYFPQNAWYYPPVFPIKFQSTTEQRQPDTSFEDLNAAGVDCICQHLFDVERFLGEFLETFKPLQHYNLVDYDLRLVRASSVERTVFIIYVMALVPSRVESKRPGTQYLRVALFLSLELFTGVHHIIRALKVPGNRDLRHISQAVARRFLADLSSKLPHEPTTTMLDNEAVLREESLHELHNPRYPISISST